MIGRENDQRVLPAPELLQRVPQLAQVIVDLLDQALIDRAHRVRDFVAREVEALFMLVIRAEHRVRVVAFRAAAHGRQALVERVQVVIGARRDIRPVRFHVREMQRPRRVALLLDVADRLARHVCRFRMRLGHARGPAHVAHFPARLDLALVVLHADDEIAPRALALVAVAAQVGRIAALAAGFVVAVVAVEFEKGARAQALAEFAGARDFEAAHAVLVHLHVGLARERERAAVALQIFAERDLADRERHAVPVRAVARHGAAGVVRHARRAAHARGDVGVVEAHAARGEGVDVARAQPGMTVAAEVIAAQLVAHDEENVAGGGHAGVSRAGARSWCGCSYCGAYAGDVREAADD